jgi:hypothetical protein
VYICLMCKFLTEYDDVVAPTVDGRCICLRCFHRQVGDERPLPATLRRLVEVTLAATV